MRGLIKELVDRKIAITSTLAVFETFTGDQFTLDPRMRQVLTPEAYGSCAAQIEHDVRIALARLLEAAAEKRDGI